MKLYELKIEDNEDEVFAIEIGDTSYFTTNEMSGKIYEMDENEDPGAQIGNFVNGTPIFSK